MTEPKTQAAHSGTYPSDCSISLRDLFAAAALAGGKSPPPCDHLPAKEYRMLVCKRCYEYADMMMEVRKSNDEVSG